MMMRISRQAVAVMLLLAPVGAIAEGFSVDRALDARKEKDGWMRDDPSSPFNYEKHPVEFSPLQYFAPTSAWVFESRLTVRPDPEPVTIFDTKGRERQGHVFGSLSFEHDGQSHVVRVYRMETSKGFYYGIWFTDRTTGDSTYEVGRYLDFELSDDPEHVYTLDFNGAYSPYCSYSPAYGCAIPRQEDFLDLAITAGEKRWHDAHSRAKSQVSGIK
ncbi:DUF1684 domain-containing protein [Opitutaceae bacterium]|nr:DUF1684 domain-containing protein [Opitutaceae bacterium]